MELFETNIGEIESGSFSGLGNIVNISLETNRLTALKAGMFNKLGALVLLSLASNYINATEDKTFSNLNKLETLYLPNNSLEVLRSGMFSGLDSLNLLNLAGNPIKILPADVFKHLPRPLTIVITEQDDNESSSNLPIQCNSDLCWLHQEELQGNITWYPAAPVCADGKVWGNWSCNKTGNPLILYCATKYQFYVLHDIYFCSNYYYCWLVLLRLLRGGVHVVFWEVFGRFMLIRTK